MKKLKNLWLLPLFLFSAFTAFSTGKVVLSIEGDEYSIPTSDSTNWYFHPNTSNPTIHDYNKIFTLCVNEVIEVAVRFPQSGANFQGQMEMHGSNQNPQVSPMMYSPGLFEYDISYAQAGTYVIKFTDFNAGNPHYVYNIKVHVYDNVPFELQASNYDCNIPKSIPFQLIDPNWPIYDYDAYETETFNVVDELGNTYPVTERPDQSIVYGHSGGGHFIPDQTNYHTYTITAILLDHCGNTIIKETQVTVGLPYNTSQIIINGNVTWTPTANPWNESNEIKIREKITINPNSSLTIKDLNLKLGKDGEVFVLAGSNSQNGGVLNLNNCEVSVYDCDPNAQWKGITAYGNTSFSSNGNHSSHAKVIAENNCRFIESKSASILGKYGAYVKVINSSFIGNKVGVQLYTTATSAVNTTSIFNGNQVNFNAKTLGNYYAIGLLVENYNGVEVKGNVFETADATLLGSTNQKDRGVGVRLINSNSTIEDLGGSNGRNQFKSLYKGVHISKSNTLGETNVRGALFTNCKAGVVIDGLGAGHNIVGNEFSSNTNAAGVNGIEIYNAQDLEINSNTFSGGYHGVYMNNTGTSSAISNGRYTNVLYNIFDNCYRSLTTENENRTLFLECNIFKSTNNVTQLHWYNRNGFAANQGSYSKPSNNQFIGSVWKDIYSTHGLHYYYYKPNGVSNPDYTPVVRTPNVAAHAVNLPIPANCIATPKILEITSVENEFNSLEVIEFKNFPNPFNGTTTISYGVASLTSGKVLIYDVCGKLVSTEILTENTGMISIDLSNVQPGIYIAQLEIDGVNVKTIKMVAK